MKLQTIRIPGLLMAVLLATSCGGESATDAGLASQSVVYRGNGGDPGSLDPAIAEDIHAFNILTDLYEGLVSLSADGELVPGVAESWSISDDKLTYTFKLRAAARWSNGAPVTPNDFVRAFRRVTSSSSTSPYAFLVDPVEDLSAVDGATLQIQLVEPAAHLLSVLSMPVAFPMPPRPDESSAYSDPSSFVGNGAYLLVSHAVGGATRLRRNPKYWGADDVAVDEVVYMSIVDPFTELNMYQSGELDITNTIPPERLAALQSDMFADVRIAPSLALYYLAFDLTEPPFDSVSLRQALNMAIDREQLVAIIGRGERPAYGIVPDGVAGYVAARFNWRDLPDEERERQARLLYKQAGYSDASPLEITYTYDAGDIHEKVALAITSMWRSVLGIDAGLEKKEWQYFLDTRDRRDKWQVMRFAWFGDYNHVSTFTDIFRSGDPQNLPRYNNAEYDRLVNIAGNQAESVLLGDHPVAPLYFYVSKHMVNPRIGGFEDNVLDRHPSKYLFVHRGE